MKRIIAILVLNLFPLFLFSQERFNILLNRGTDFKQIKTIGNSYYAVGGAFLPGTGAVTIAKLDSVGNILWMDTVSSYPDFSDTPILLPTNDAIYLAYRLSPNADNFNFDDFDIILRKMDLNGNVLFEKRFGGNKYETAYDIKFDHNQNILIAGATKSFNRATIGMYLVCADTLGNLLWQRDYHNDNGSVAAIDFIGNHEILLSGNMFVAPTQNSYGQWDMKLMKVDSVGNEIWSRTQGSIEDDRPLYLKVKNETHFFALGGIGSENSVKSDPYISEWDLNGNLVWEKTLDIPEHCYFTEESILDPDGTIHTLAIANNSLEIQIGRYFKLDPLGNVINDRSYFRYEQYEQYLFDIEKPIDGNGFLFYGSAIDTVIGQRGWLIKTDCFGCDGALCDYGDSICSTYDCTQFPLNANFTASTNTLDLQQGGVIQFQHPNQSIPVTRNWYFGDGAQDYTFANRQHTYQTAGSYTAMLVIGHGLCADTSFQTIEVINSLGVNQFQNSEIRLYPNPTTGSFTLSHNAALPTSYSIYNGLGVLIQTGTFVKEKLIELKEAGVYLVVTTAENGTPETHQLIVTPH